MIVSTFGLSFGTVVMLLVLMFEGQLQHASEVGGVCGEVSEHLARLARIRSAVGGRSDRILFRAVEMIVYFRSVIILHEGTAP